VISGWLRSYPTSRYKLRVASPSLASQKRYVEANQTILYEMIVHFKVSSKYEIMSGCVTRVNVLILLKVVDIFVDGMKIVLVARTIPQC